MKIVLDLEPLERLLAHVDDIGEAACAHAAGDVLGRLRANEPVLSGALLESLGVKVGTHDQVSYAVIGPESDKTADDARQTPPVRYQDWAQEHHGDFMRTLLDGGDVEALAEGAAEAIKQVLHGAGATR